MRLGRRLPGVLTEADFTLGRSIARSPALSLSIGETSDAGAS